MPIPFIIGGLAAAAAAGGVGSGIKGGVKMKNANDTKKKAERIHNDAINKFEIANAKTTKQMDRIGELELSILDSFGEFSDLIEKIQGRPEFGKIHKHGVDLPTYEPEELKKVSTGAAVLKGGLTGAAAGTAGGVAAAGATTSAVMALGSASTGAAISSLSGVAATNATLAALGGGAVTAGGWGMALGTVVLNGATLGAGLLVGGVIFNITGSKLSNQADEALNQANKIKAETDEIVKYLEALYSSASIFEEQLTLVNDEYEARLDLLDYIIYSLQKTRWSDFTDEEKVTIQNLILLVGLLYKMCKTQLVLKSEDDNETNKVNYRAVRRLKREVNKVLENLDNID